ncbi:MAG TPA: phospholipase D-like domain-containing protein [Chitinophagaceae bacterium]|nr:phospholipase D-like domain-containing protein [Chitinophagaceae bacterium]
MAGKTKKPSSNFTLHNKVQLLCGGTEFYAQLHAIINNSTHAFYLQTYIFEDDETGRSVADALLTAVKRGVQVYLMIDAYASHALPKQFVKHLQQGGIHFRFFEPFFKSRHFYIGRRMHHKLAVADAMHCIVGGINVGNKYNDFPAQPGWLDFAVYVHGQAAREVCLVARQMWRGMSAQKASEDCTVHGFKAGMLPHMPVRLRRNDWVRNKIQISKTYRQIFTTATSHITILCSYFMPGNMMKKYILRATKRGVKIKVIMAGRSDVALAKNAERFMYDWLLRNGVEIYEYLPNILHGKLAVCDSAWVTVGSYNINNISAYASVELNLDIDDSAFATHTEYLMQRIIKNDCTRVTKAYKGNSRNIFKQFINWCSYEIVRLLFYLFTFYFRQRGN